MYPQKSCVIILKEVDYKSSTGLVSFRFVSALLCRYETYFVSDDQVIKCTPPTINTRLVTRSGQSVLGSDL